MTILEKQIQTITWRGLPLPVYVHLNSHGQPCSVPNVRIEDMPQGLRRDIEFWATKIRAEPMLMPPPACPYNLDDFESFAAWFASLDLEATTVVCIDCGEHFGQRRPNPDGVTGIEGVCDVCGRGPDVIPVRDFGGLSRR